MSYRALLLSVLSIAASRAAGANLIAEMPGPLYLGEAIEFLDGE